MKQLFISFSLLLIFFYPTAAQNILPDNQLKFHLNEEGTKYIRITGLAQVWLRNTQMNAGSTIDDYHVDSYTDISIRRLRFQIYGQLTDRVFFYTQFGQNNFNFHSPKYQGAFFHDAVVEYALVPKKLSLGTGLTGWSGLTRYASPSIGAVMPLDVPLYQQATNGVNDQFIRKLSIYAKGQLGNLDYRVALSNPMTVTPVAPEQDVYSFSSKPPKMQWQGYFKYMFFDRESNLTPYESGSYLGQKNIFNLGAGVIYQPEAMWAIDNGNTVHKDMLLIGFDAFLDKPLSENTALTTYLALTNYDFGSGYIRNVGVNNPATGSANSAPGGFGNAFPMVGTGGTLYVQVGYLFGQDLLSPDGKLQPFVTMQQSDYDLIADLMTMYELGFNYLINGSHNSKLSFMYQNRPTFKTTSDGIMQDSRKGMSVLQYQVSF